MPANFPEIWLNRVIQELDNTDAPTWIAGVNELDVNVTEINAGTVSEKNKIYIPTTEFEVDVLINNNTYPLAVQQYEDGTVEVSLDKYQTKVVTLSDDQIMGASYPKIDATTRSMRHGLTSSKYKKAIHSVAPLSSSTDTPILEATGGSGALEDSTGRKRLTYEDLVAFKEKCSGMGDVRLVLCESHWNDLLLDRKNFGNQLVDYVKGKPNPMIAGFELHQYKNDAMPVYTSALAKKPFGAVKAPTDRVASVAFVLEGVTKKTGLTKQYFTSAAQNPATQTNDLAYRHYFVMVPFRNKKIGAIV